MRDGQKPPTWDDRLAKPELSWVDSLNAGNWRHCGVGEALDLQRPLSEDDDGADIYLTDVIGEETPELEALGLAFSRRVADKNAPAALKVKAQIHELSLIHI